jgi:hypothetical protein
MSFAEAQLLQFTGEHQPSLATALLRKDVVAKKKQAHERSKLGSSRVVHISTPNITKLKNKAYFIFQYSQRVKSPRICGMQQLHSTPLYLFPICGVPLEATRST